MVRFDHNGFKTESEIMATIQYCNGDSPKFPTDRPFIQNNTGDPGLATFLLKRREECSISDWEVLCTEHKFAVYSLYSEMLYDFFCNNWKKRFKRLSYINFRSDRLSS